MTIPALVSVLLAAQQATTEAEADALLDRLADPHTRELARREWRELHAASVTRISDDQIKEAS